MPIVVSKACAYPAPSTHQGTSVMYIPGSPPPPGPPPGGGQTPGGSPSTPKKPRVVRAKLNQIKRTLTVGRTKTVKTEEIKKKKKVKDDQGQGAPVPTNIAPGPAPVQVITQYVQVPVPVHVPMPVPMMGMPAPVTQNDLNYLAYLQGQPLGYHMPQPPVQHMPVIVTTQQQHPFIASQPPQHSPHQPSFTLSASQPATFSSGGKNWNDRASECMADLMDRLERGDRDEVASGFALLRDVALERKFTGETIDGWIAAALATYKPEELKRVYENAIELLSDSLLAQTVRLGIRRMLVPHELINAIMTKDWAKTLQLADLIRECCDPAKWGDEKPDAAQAKRMMWDMLDRVVATLTDRQLYALHLALPGESKHPAILALSNLLAKKYGDRIIHLANTFDQ
jgi:hypothetical protein